MTATVLNTKISEVENKIANVSGLVKKLDYDTKIKDIENKNLLLLIITNLRVKHLIQRSNKKNYLTIWYF